MTASILQITPGETVTVHRPMWFAHHGEKVAADALEDLYSLPAYLPPNTDDAPLFIAPWERGGDRIRPDRKAAWCKALRSGEYRQIRGSLRDRSDGRCALGVAREICPDEISLVDWLGVSDDAYTHLRNTVMRMNDRLDKSFSEIADYIEGAW